MAGCFLNRCLTLFLTLSLALGQSAYAPMMAAAATTQDMEMAMDMASADMPCCPNSDKDHQGAKADMCASVCAAMTQAALPLPVAVFIPDATSLTYDYADSVAPDRLLPPDSPPPKA